MRVASLYRVPDGVGGDDGGGPPRASISLWNVRAPRAERGASQYGSRASAASPPPRSAVSAAAEEATASTAEAVACGWPPNDRRTGRALALGERAEAGRRASSAALAAAIRARGVSGAGVGR